METHRYVRSQLSSNSIDRYNGAGVAGMSSKHGTPQNYWTNGVITEYWTASTKYQAEQRTSSGSAIMVRTQPLPPAPPASHSAHHHQASTSSAGVRGGQQQQQFNKVHASLIAGSCAGIVSTFCMYPAEVLRVKMQTSACHKVGPLQAVQNTVSHGGFRALYTGLSLPLAAQMVYKATVFTVNNLVQNLIVDYKTLEMQKLGNTNAQARLTMTDRFWCGAVAGSINAACFVTPVEFVRNQLIAQHTKLAAAQAKGTNATAYFQGAFCVVRDAWQNQGLLSLWRGASWSVSRDALGMGCFFYTMHWTQTKLTPPEESRPSFWTTVASGGLAGLSFWFVALPMDTAKTWIQTASSAEEVSVKKVLQKIYGENGATGVIQRLYRGWQAAFGRSVPSAAITLTSYTLMYQYLQEAL